MRKLKALLYKILCNSFTGSIILATHKRFIPDLRSNNFSFAFDSRFVNKQIIASIFFGFYERGEIRFIKKYLNPGFDVIELGSSLGIVSAHIINKLKNNSQLILVEANPYLPEIIHANVKKHNTNKITYQLLNSAISYSGDFVNLEISSDNTESHVSKNVSGTSSTVSVKTISLGDIVKKFQLNKYSIVCDIEGSEIEWLLNESESLFNCKQLLIELHPTEHEKHYSIEDLKKIIIYNHGFKLIDCHGPVCYFEK